MVLTDLRIRNAKATGKAYKLGDYDGLSLFVSAKGSKAWHFRYNWLGNRSRMSLGTYPELSLRDARAMQDEARALIAKGINPGIARKQKQQAARLAGEYTFMTVYERWLAYRTVRTSFFSVSSTKPPSTLPRTKLRMGRESPYRQVNVGA